MEPPTEAGTSRPVVVFRDHTKQMVVGTMMALVFVLFYLMTVFALSWGTTALGYTRQQFLMIQLSATTSRWRQRSR